MSGVTEDERNGRAKGQGHNGNNRQMWIRAGHRVEKGAEGEQGLYTSYAA
jgi:hypothetical protein